MDNMVSRARVGYCTSGSVTAWDSESESDEPIMEMMESIFQALDRLDRHDQVQNREDGLAISV
jgi:hypothetical protein